MSIIPQPLTQFPWRVLALLLAMQGAYDGAWRLCYYTSAGVAVVMLVLIFIFLRPNAEYLDFRAPTPPGKAPDKEAKKSVLLSMWSALVCCVWLGASRRVRVHRACLRCVCCRLLVCCRCYCCSRALGCGKL